MQSSRDPQLGRHGLYALTVALELPTIMARYAVAFVLASLLMRMGGHTTNPGGWAKLAVLPTLWSALALLHPGGGSGRWWQERVGGRRPSEREWALYREAMAQLQAGTAAPLPTPRRWFVMANPEPDAAVCGDTLMLSSGLLESEHLPAALAHQLGHLRSLDARMTLALSRLVFKPAWRSDPERPRRVSLTRWLLRAIAWLPRGGIALHLTAPAWAKLWRDAEFAADAFAASLGRAAPLADFLQEHALPNDHPIPLVALSAHTHPPTEHRIERLRAVGQPQGASAAHATAPARVRPDARGLYIVDIEA